MAGTSSTENYNEKGILRRIQSVLTDTKKQIEDKGKFINGKQSILDWKNLNTVETDISSMNNRLKQIENRYYTKFTAMEKAIQKMNEQSTYLAQLLGQ